MPSPIRNVTKISKKVRRINFGPRWLRLEVRQGLLNDPEYSLTEDAEHELLTEFKVWGMEEVEVQRHPCLDGLTVGQTFDLYCSGSVTAQPNAEGLCYGGVLKLKVETPPE